MRIREKLTVDEEGVLIPGGSAQQKERMAAPRCALKIHCNHLEEDVVMTFNKQVKKQTKKESTFRIEASSGEKECIIVRASA